MAVLLVPEVRQMRRRDVVTRSPGPLARARQVPRRRDAQDLALMRIEQLERDESVLEFAVRLLAGLVRSEHVDVIRRLLPDALPWVTFLPDTDFEPFVTELLAVARGAAELGNLAPVAVLLTQWRHSAEVYADPVLFEILTKEPEGDLGSVPVPPLNE